MNNRRGARTVPGVHDLLRRQTLPRQFADRHGSGSDWAESASDALEKRHRPQRFDIYLSLENHLNNWKRLGFGDEDVAKPGSDRLVDTVAATAPPVPSPT